MNCTNEKLQYVEVDCFCIDDSEQGIPNSECPACNGFGYVEQPCCYEHLVDHEQEQLKKLFNKEIGKEVYKL